MALTTDTLFVGCTRPTLVWGVTYEAFLFNAAITSIAFLGAGNVLYFLIALPIHAVCYLICAGEPRQFELIALWSKTKGRNLNRRLWQSSSYSPLEPFREQVKGKKAEKGTK